MPDYSFELKQPSDFLKKLHIEQARYLADPLSSVDAMNFTWTAQHLTEWVWKGHLETQRSTAPYKQTPLASLKDVNDFKVYIYGQCPEMKIMRDIANGSKHFSLDSKNPRVQDTDLHIGDFSREDFNHDDWNISTLLILLDDSSLAYFEDTIQPVVDFWDKFFATYSIP